MRRRILSLSLVPGALLALLLWLTTTAGGLATLGRLAENLSGQRLRLTQPDGRLAGPLTLEALDWNSPTLKLHADKLRLDWSPGALLGGSLAIAELSVATLRIDDRSPPAATPPASLRLPLAVHIARLAVGRLEYGTMPALREIAGRFDSDGRQHVLEALQATLGDIKLDGRARLDGRAPFPLTASAEIAGQLKEHPLAAKLGASGRLAEVHLQATARSGVRGTAALTLTPFATAPFGAAEIRLDDLDPAAWVAGAPSAKIDLQGDFAPGKDGIAGNFSLRNKHPAPLDRQGLPLTELRGQLAWQGELVRLTGLQATLSGGGALSGRGEWRERALRLDLRAARLDAASLFGALRGSRLNGSLGATLASARQELEFDLRDAHFALAGAASHAAGRIVLSRLLLAADRARLTARGELSLADLGFAAEGELAHFDPARFARLPAADINATFSGRGKLRPTPQIAATFNLEDSRLAGQALAGQGRLDIAWPNVRRADIDLLAGPNRLRSRGAFGRPGDRLSLELAAPQLAPYGLSGGIDGHFELQGTPRRPSLNARLRSEHLARPGLFAIDALTLDAALGSAANAPLQIDLAIGQLATPGQSGLLRRLHLQASGQRQSHRLTLTADLAGRDHLKLAASGGLSETATTPLWRGSIDQAELQAADPARNFHLLAPAPAALAGSGWQLGPARLAGQPLDWQATLQASADRQRLKANLTAHGSRLGNIEANLAAGLLNPWQLAPDAPWQGRLTADIANLGWLGELIGEQWTSAGRLHGEIQLAGTPAKPLTGGRLHGSDLALRQTEQGLDLAHGELDIALADNRLRIVKLGFDSLLQRPPRALRLALKERATDLADRPGRLEISGEMQLGGVLGADQATLDVHLERLGAWQLPDQWVAVSGDGRLSLQAGTFGARGQLTVDAGYWQLAQVGVPRLSDDVTIHRPNEEKSGLDLHPKLDIDIATNLGRNFLFSGAGLAARLAGQVRLRAEGRDLPRASGTIRIVDGRFDAYGQQLAIDRGILNFQGLLDNPALDVRAVRRGLAVEPGVQIGGTARKPAIRLISDPELPDAEKLSWLVLGHGPEQMGAGDASLLLSAAGGLLGNNSGGLVQQLKQNFGIDELGVRTGQIGGDNVHQQGSRIAGSGVDTSDSTGQQIFSIGKRLSSNALLSYEQVLGKAESVVKLSVSLSRRISVVGRAGSDNAIDLFYTFSFGQAGKKKSD